MDEKNSIPDSSPAHAAQPTDHTVPLEGDITPAPEKRPSRRRGLLIAGGAVLAAAVLTGGGVAVAAALDDGWGDDAETTAVDENDDESAGDDDSDDDLTTADLADLGTTSADDLIEMTDAATAAADGDPVSIELKQEGAAEVTLEAADGAETEVRVTAGGEASVVSTDAADGDDSAPENTLDAEAIQALVTAALDEVDGRVLEIEAENDASSPWEVTVVGTDGKITEVRLDAQFAPVESQTD